MKIALNGRQSMCKFSFDPVPDDMLHHQPWRLIVVKNQGIKEKIKIAAFNQKYMNQAHILLRKFPQGFGGMYRRTHKWGRLWWSTVQSNKN